MEKKRQTIFIVDDDITNLITAKSALNGMYDVFALNSGEQLLKILDKIIPDLILMDVQMPEMSGYDVVKLLKNNEKTANIPFIFLTAKDDDESELEGLSLGAIDYITKPFSPRLLHKRVEVHLLVEAQKQELQNYNDNLQKMVNAKTKTVMELQNAVLNAIAELVEWRDGITGGHIERTQNYLRVLVNALLSQDIYKEEVLSWDLDLVLQSAQLHDVGKIAIKDGLLQKPDKLTYEEFEEMKTHTTFGVKIIEKIKKNTSEQAFLEHARILVGAHHEKWDGSGYPFGLKGEEIPLQGRLMALVDVYDALVSERPYKKAFTHEEAVRIILDGRGTHFDPILADLFFGVASEFNKIAMLYQSDADGNM